MIYTARDMIALCDKMIAEATPRQRKARLEGAYLTLRACLMIVSETAAVAQRTNEGLKRIVRQHEEWERLHDIPNLGPLLDDELPPPTQH